MLGTYLMDITCISDLHGFYPELEGGDLLIVAGDLTATNGYSHIIRFKNWIFENFSKYLKICFIAGNHDNWIQERFLIYSENFLNRKINYLEDSETEFEGLKIWGSPWTRTFSNMNPSCMAFTCDSEEKLSNKWDLIPDDIDILVTHGPPYGMLDEVRRCGFDHNSYIENTGSISLRDTVDRVKPKLHVFGHIHEHGGKQLLYKHAGPNTIMVNAAYVDERYRPVNKPFRVIL